MIIIKPKTNVFKLYNWCPYTEKMIQCTNTPTMKIQPREYLSFPIRQYFNHKGVMYCATDDLSESYNHKIINIDEIAHEYAIFDNDLDMKKSGYKYDFIDSYGSTLTATKLFDDGLSTLLGIDSYERALTILPNLKNSHSILNTFYLKTSNGYPTYPNTVVLGQEFSHNAPKEIVMPFDLVDEECGILVDHDLYAKIRKLSTNSLKTRSKVFHEKPVNKSQKSYFKYFLHKILTNTLSRDNGSWDNIMANRYQIVSSLKNTTTVNKVLYFNNDAELDLYLLANSHTCDHKVVDMSDSNSVRAVINKLSFSKIKPIGK